MIVLIRSKAIMPRAISNDLRKRIIDLVNSGCSAREAAKRFKVSASFSTKLVKRFRETGSYFATKLGGYKPLSLSFLEKDIINLVEAYPDWSESSYTEHLKEHYNITVSRVTLGRFIRRLGYRYKKNGIRERTRQS